MWLIKPCSRQRDRIPSPAYLPSAHENILIIDPFGFLFSIL